MRRSVARLVPCLVACALLGACASGTPPASAPAGSGAVVTPSPSASPASSPSPIQPAPPPSGAPPVPTPSAVATPTPATTPPSVETFWDVALRGLAAEGRLRITVIGPNPGILRYQPDASATVADGKVVFVCVAGAAFDGQSGSFTPVPGAWECGGSALVGGFRNTGQPVDAWSEALPTDSQIGETTSREPDGRWRWDYSAHSPVFGGTVRATVWLDPASGRILDARRSDPTGETRYGISYSEAFPPIVRP